MLTIGIQRGEDAEIDEEEILAAYEKAGFKHDEDNIIVPTINDERVGYFIIEKSNYIIFREEDSIESFTAVVIPYIATLTDADQIIVKEDPKDVRLRNDYDDCLFTGSATEFLAYWNELEGEE
jgi:hypothetical protein